MINRTAALLACLASLAPTAASAVVFTYTDETDYLAKLGTLGLAWQGPSYMSPLSTSPLSPVAG